jgi:hypothetical protein
MKLVDGFVRGLVSLAIANIILVPLMMFAPVIYLTLPFYSLVTNPSIDLPSLAFVLFWIGPLSCAFYLLVSCHWPTVRRAQREGRLATWRESEGGMLCTVTKASAYMVLGLLGSFFAETGLIFLYPIPKASPWGMTLWFTLLPGVTFAPVILLWLSRWMRGRKQGDFISRAKNDCELQDQLRAASLYAKNLRRRNAH